MLRGTSPLNSQQQQLLFVGRAKNFQSTADQALNKVFAGTAYIVTDVIARCKSGGATVACAGGIYTAAAKGGNLPVAAGQSWLGLGAVDNQVTATVAQLASVQTAAQLFLSLTTGSTAAVTGDVFVYGVIVD